MIDSLQSIVKAVEPWTYLDLEHPKRWIATSTVVVALATLIIQGFYDEFPVTSFLTAASLISVIGYAITKEFANIWVSTVPLNKAVVVLSLISTGILTTSQVINRHSELNLIFFGSVLVIFSTFCLANFKILSKPTSEFVEFKDRSLKDRKVCLILTSTIDHNSLFKRIAPQVMSRLKTQNDFEVVTHKVTSLEDIENRVEKLKTARCEIEVLWLRCHGNVTKLAVYRDSKNEDFVDSSDENLKTFKQIFSKLSSNATIVLESCLMGQGPDSFAKKLSDISGGRKVLALKDESSFEFNELLSTKPFNIRFYDFIGYKKRDLTVEFS